MATNEPSQEVKILRAMKTASETVRSAIAQAIPVASNQVLTVSVPGTVINWEDFYYDPTKHIAPPTHVRVKEARLVDGMIPLSKFSAGKSGKSVARSYLAALDLLVPVEASVSGVIGDTQATVSDVRLKTIQTRYNNAMEYLKSASDIPGAAGTTKVGTYVSKQAAWAEEVSRYSRAQGDALAARTRPNATSDQIKEGREEYSKWLQENSASYRNSIQAKYMDWVVHGYKFMVDYHFGIVDISSGMKRIENSKEAFRGGVLVSDDGSSEYHAVVLNPSDWAKTVRDKAEVWYQSHKKPSPSEIRAEIRRLESLKISHQTLKDGVTSNAFFPVINGQGTHPDDSLKKAYAEVYHSIDTKNYNTIKGTAISEPVLKKWYDMYPKALPPTPPPTPPAEKDEEDDPFSRLVDAQAKYNDTALSRNTSTVREGGETNMKTAQTWLDNRIIQITGEIELLQEQLKDGDKSAGNKVLALPVVNEQGVIITEEDIKADKFLTGVKKMPESLITVKPEQSDPWTKIACRASSKNNKKESSTFNSASAIAAKAGWGLLKVSGGASHTQSVAKAMESMSNLDVDITMDCMVVEIERPWLHAELFVDAELDSGLFDISPGEDALKEAFNKEQNLSGAHQQFSSFPTAFVIAADVELSFSGDTTHLESAVSASSTSANLSVGYGPFSVNASHSQNKSNSKTKMESTATGCKISLGSPQIIGWVQTLLPQLPKPKEGKSTMTGLFNL